ncbi:MAG: zinc metallopeptidase [Planctomycetes bacterium]|nr:zinc metallopeptidase [Planctomycetota bacterium]
MFFHPYQLLFAIPALLLAFWAQARVKRAFHKYSEVTLRRPISGADVAWAIVRSSGLEGVKVEPIHGHLTDHYDPRTRTLRLSEPVHDSRSIAAVGVAAHEAGHSLQHAAAYLPLQVRSAWVPLAGFGSQFSILVILLGAFLGPAIASWVKFPGATQALVWAGIGLYSLVVAFTLITLPVEFDASRRAVALLSQKGIVTREEEAGVREVLNAAALTYVAAAVGSILQLIYLILRFGGAGRSRDE